MTAPQQRYDEIEWSCNYAGESLTVKAFDLENQKDIEPTEIKFRAILERIYPEGLGKHIECTQWYFKDDAEGGYMEEQTQKFMPVGFFAEIFDFDTESWLSIEGYEDYISKLKTAVQELLHGIINPVILK